MLIIRKRPELTLRSLALVSNHRMYSKDYASSDDENDHKKQKKPKTAKLPAVQEEAAAGDESASARLNRLLGSMRTDDTYTLAQQAASMARPGDANKKRKEAAKQEAASKDVIAAAKRVASMLGGEEHKKQTESELLAKLLGHNQDDNAATTNMETGDGAVQGQESELSLSELIVGMKIDRRHQPKEQMTSRGDFVRRTLAAKTSQQGGGSQGKRTHQQRERGTHKREPETYTGSVNIFGGEPLGIFKDPASLRESTDILKTWAQLERRELKLQVAHPPANYFEKMALWTEQGKVWRFPIDNEQSLAEEADVDFSEHIFLEQHLDPWCPSKGPIRHFMELVCVGLSKNSYITAKDKKEHIDWYRDYFEAKKDILRELMSKEKMDQLSAGDGKIEA